MIVDGGATNHVTGNNGGIYELVDVSSILEYADATIMDANLVGKLDEIINAQNDMGYKILWNKTGIIMQKLFYDSMYFVNLMFWIRVATVGLFVNFSRVYFKVITTCY